MKLYFYTTNRFKFRVADEIFSRYGINPFMVKPDFTDSIAKELFAIALSKDMGD